MRYSVTQNNVLVDNVATPQMRCRLITASKVKLISPAHRPSPQECWHNSTAPNGIIARLAEFCLVRLNARGNQFRICARVKIRFVTPDLCPWYGATECGGAH